MKAKLVLGNKSILFSLGLFLLANSFSYSQYIEWQNFTNGNTINCITVQGDTAWVGTTGGLAKVSISLNTAVFYDKVTDGLPVNDIRAIAIDRNGGRWIGTYGGGVASFKNGTWTIYSSLNSRLPEDKIISVAVDSNDIVWIGTESSGLVKFNGTDWTIFTSANTNLISNYIFSLAVDQSSSVWIGTDAGCLNLAAVSFPWPVCPINWSNH